MLGSAGPRGPTTPRSLWKWLDPIRKAQHDIGCAVRPMLILCMEESSKVRLNPEPRRKVISARRVEPKSEPGLPSVSNPAVEISQTSIPSKVRLRLRRST